MSSDMCGGARPSGSVYDQGYFHLPTIFEGLANNTRLCQEEVFGPVLVLLPWETEVDLVAQCNDNVYGLACGVWSRDFQTALRLGKAINTGTVWVNTYKLFSISTPFGGMGQSGMGREKGQASIAEYMTQKSYYLGLNPSPLPWAGVER